MLGYLTTPIPIKKYIKVPDRRLISGFLHINVISHSDNDDKLDAYQYYRDKEGDHGMDDDQHQADPWRGQDVSSFTDTGRSAGGSGNHDKFLTFGDYDCLLYWIAGGMTLNPVLYTGSALSAGVLGYRGFPDTTPGVWYNGIDDYCQNFMKYDLISRINNGYGHAALNSSELYHGTIAVTKNEFRSDELGISGHDSTVTPPDYDTAGGESPNAHGGNFQKHIVSCGSHSTSASTGDGDINLSTGSANTFFPPVHDIKVYGIHRINIVSQQNSAKTDTVYSIATSGGYHVEDFWNLVIQIDMRGYDDGWTSGSPSAADTEWFQSRTNVFFQPFGETASFAVSDTEHTS